MRRMIIFLSFVVVVSIMTLLVARLGGRQFLYHPTALNRADLDTLTARTRWSVQPLPIENGPTLQGLVRPPRTPQSPWILFWGGNAMDLASSKAILAMSALGTDWGLAVWAYRGYDGSGGHPTEEELMGDATRQVAFLQHRFGVVPDRLVLMGQSLGTGVATQTAASLTRQEHPPAGLVLISPYTSISAVAGEKFGGLPIGWLLPDTYRTDQRLPLLQNPVLIIHGDQDDLIPVAHGRRVADTLGLRAELTVLRGRGHNDVWEDEQTPRGVQRFVRRLFSSAPRKVGIPLAPEREPGD